MGFKFYINGILQDLIVGNRKYDEENIITDEETITASLNKLDIALNSTNVESIGDRQYTNNFILDNDESITSSLNKLDSATNYTYVIGYNNTGSSIAKNTLVKLVGEIDGVTTIAPVANYLDEIYGVTKNEILTGEQCRVIQQGVVTASLDTTGKSINDFVYATDSGVLTLTETEFVIGQVLSQEVNGKIHINIYNYLYEEFYLEEFSYSAFQDITKVASQTVYEITQDENGDTPYTITDGTKILNDVDYLSITDSNGKLIYKQGSVLHTKKNVVKVVSYNPATREITLNEEPKTDFRINFKALYNRKNVPVGKVLNAGAYFNVISSESTNEASEIEYDNTTSGIVAEDVQSAIDEHLNDRDILKEPTGFAEPDDVIVTDNGNRSITLSGTVNAYYRGVKNTTLINGYISPIHDNTTTTTFFLTYDGTNIAWRDLSSYSLDFSEILICIAVYDTNNTQWFYLRESHGLMAWETHRAEHLTIGTYKVSGGASDGIILPTTTTPAERRPDITQTIIRDEDLTTTLNLLNTKSYTQGFNNGTGVFNFEIDQNDIMPLSTNNPLYNSFDGTNWGQTLMPANSVATVWVFAVPVCAGTTCQKYRYVFVQPQWITQSANPSAGQLAIARSQEEARQISELNITTLTTLLPESVGILRYTIQYTGGNWTIQNALVLGGTRLSQTQTPAGNFLQSVSSDDTLQGDGTAGNLLGISDTWGDLENKIYVSKSGNDLNDGKRPQSAFLTIQAAINSITDATTTKRYVLDIDSGDYVESVVLKDYVFISGANTATTRISGTSGTLLTLPATDGSKCIEAITGGIHILRNMEMFIDSAVDGAICQFTDVDCTLFNMAEFYAEARMTGSDATAKLKDYFSFKGSTTVSFARFAVDIEDGDINDSIGAIYDASTGRTKIEAESISVKATNVAFSGSSVLYAPIGTGTALNTITIENGNLESLGNGNGYAISFLSGASGVSEIRNSTIKVSGFTNNYGYFIDTGDTLNALMTYIDASSGNAVSGTLNSIGMDASGDISITNDLSVDKVFHNYGAITQKSTTLSVDTTLDNTHNKVYCDNAGAITITLPNATIYSDIIYSISNINTGTTTIGTTASQLINGNATKALSGIYATVTLQAVGSQWVILNTNSYGS